MTNFLPSSKYDQWPGCRHCKHLGEDELTCAAYPDGIPLPIWSGECDHMVLRPGQNGTLLFESLVALQEHPLVQEAQRLVYAADSIEKCDAAGARLTEIIAELGDDEESIAAVRGYAEMLIMTKLALQEEPK